MISPFLPSPKVAARPAVDSRRPPSDVDAILATCAACEWNQDGVCEHPGIACPPCRQHKSGLRDFAMSRSSSCPANRWPTNWNNHVDTSEKQTIQSKPKTDQAMPLNTQFLTKFKSNLPSYWKIATIRCSIYAFVVACSAFDTGVEGFDSFSQMTSMQQFKLWEHVLVAVATVWVAFLDQSITSLTAKQKSGLTAADVTNSGQ